MDFTNAPLAALASVDLTSPAFKADPFPFYARLRANAPVFAVKIPRGRRAWLVTRYKDVADILEDHRRFAKEPRHAMTAEQLARAPRIPRLFRALERNLLSLDDADHDRLKTLVHKAFTPRLVEQLRDSIQAVTDARIDVLLRRGGGDLVADLALPVPLFVIGRILGIPEEDHARFGRWTRAFVSIGAGGNPFLLVPSVLRFMWYLRRAISARRARPRDDLISSLVRAQEGNDSLSDDEILSMVFLLLSAGHETTVNLIGSGVLALLQHPEQLARLRREPERIKSAIEELVRYAAPVEMATERFACEDVEVAGTRIRRGELVFAVIASANRDTSQFEGADRVDITREPNRHLGFGRGLHYCLGAPLSRLEAQIAIGTLVARAPGLRLATGSEPLRWRRSFIVRGLQTLPTTL